MTINYDIGIKGIPDGHIVVGYVVVAKVLDEKGRAYWGTRYDGLNDMEAYGMLRNATDNVRLDLTNGRIISDD